MKVVVIGGGIAGLTTATLLQEIGFSVCLLEASDSLGGLAKSGRTTEGFPYEHSLRVYHQTYDCLFTLYKKIPYNDQKSLFSQLTPIQMALHGKHSSFLHSSHKTNFISKIKGFINLLIFLYRQGLCWKDFWQLFQEEIIIRYHYSHFLKRYANKTCNDFLEKLSLAYKETIFAIHQATFVADPNTSAMLGIEFDTQGKPFSFFAMANGPTSEKIFLPWENYLLKQGVIIKKNARVKDFVIEQNVINAVKLEDGELIDGNFFISAVSNISFAKLAKTTCLQQYPSFKKIQINNAWSNGVQFYLRALPKTPDSFRSFVPGKLQLYLDSPWKIATVIQGPGFWQEVTLPTGCQYVLSVTFTVIDVPGSLYQKPLIECDKEEIAKELLYQCGFTEQELVIDWHMDEAIQFMSQHEYAELKSQLSAHLALQRKDRSWLVNFSPVNLSTPQTLKTQPSARTEINNFYLAGDFCETAMLVPTMEKACESGFLAAHVLAEDCGKSLLTPLPFNSYQDKSHRLWRHVDLIINKLKPAKKNFKLRR